MAVMLTPAARGPKQYGRSPVTRLLVPGHRLRVKVECGQPIFERLVILPQNFHLWRLGRTQREAGEITFMLKGFTLTPFGQSAYLHRRRRYPVSTRATG